VGRAWLNCSGMGTISPQFFLHFSPNYVQPMHGDVALAHATALN